MELEETMDDDQDEKDGIVLLEVGRGDAALVFTEQGLQAYLPEDMAHADQQDLPWHLHVVDRAMVMIRDMALEAHATEHAENCKACQEETLLALAAHQAAGEA